MPFEIKREHVVHGSQIIGIGAAALAPHVLMSVGFIAITLLITIRAGGFEIESVEELENEYEHH